MSGIRTSTGRTPSNIPPNTTVLRYFFLYTHSLHVPLDTTHPCFPRGTSAHHIGHIHSCAFLHLFILFFPLNMPKPSQPSLDTFNAQNDSIVNRYAFYHLTTLLMHILCTTILSALFNLSRSSAFIAHVLLVPYTNTL